MNAARRACEASRHAARLSEVADRLGVSLVSDKRPSDIDQLVAARLKAKRQDVGVTQVALATALGVTFQQVQKYESGANRITIGCLYRIAKALDVPITCFFEGLPEAGPIGSAGATSRDHADREVKVQANVDAERRNARARKIE